MIRPMVMDDVDGVVALVNSVEDAGLTSEGFKARLDDTTEGRLVARQVAIDESGQVIGYASIVHDPWMKTGQWQIWVAVHPEQRGHHTGSQLFDAVLKAAQEQGGVATLESDVRDNDPASLSFAQQRGFTITQHLSFSSVVIEAPTETMRTEAFKQLQAQGLTLAMFVVPPLNAEIENTIIPLLQMTSTDQPERSAPMTADEVRQGLEPDPGRQTLISAAYYDQTCVAASILRVEAAGCGTQSLTGVLREWRGHGIAMALKQILMHEAYMQGVRRIRTVNHMDNAPMLAINHRLGYQRDTGQYWLHAASPTVPS